MVLRNSGSVLATWGIETLSRTLALRHGATEAIDMKPERDRAVA
jgi:hypothetical protein